MDSNNIKNNKRLKSMLKRIIHIIRSTPHAIHMYMYRQRKPWIAQGKYGLYYRIIPNSALEYHIVQFGIFNDWIAIHLSDLLSKDSVVLDIGANVGLLTLPFSKQVPQGKIYAFEPDNVARESLEENIRLNKLINVIVFPFALQDDVARKSITFYKRETKDADGLTNKGLSSIEAIEKFTIETVRVPATTVDAIISNQKINHIDFIKIDVEGAEVKVLKGARNTIKKYMPIILYEYSTTIDILASSHNSEESFLFLKQLGYKQYEIVNERKFRLLKQPEVISGSNILCFPSNKIPNIVKS